MQSIVLGQLSGNHYLLRIVFDFYFFQTTWVEKVIVIRQTASRHTALKENSEREEQQNKSKQVGDGILDKSSASANRFSRVVRGVHC